MQSMPGSLPTVLRSTPEHGQGMLSSCTDVKTSINQAPGGPAPHAPNVLPRQASSVVATYVYMKGSRMLLLHDIGCLWCTLQHRGPVSVLALSLQQSSTAVHKSQGCAGYGEPCTPGCGPWLRPHQWPVIRSIPVLRLRRPRRERQRQWQWLHASSACQWSCRA